jgi:non-homologous end joining protein Ku
MSLVISPFRPHEAREQATMPKAAPSTRSSGAVILSFNLVNIPCSLYTGTVSAAGVERHEYLPVPVFETDDKGQILTDKDGQPIQKTREVEVDGKMQEVPVYEDHPVGRGLVDKVTGDLIPNGDKDAVQRKVETEYGPVFVEDSEIEELFTLEADTLKILEFEPQHLFYRGGYVPKTVMFLEPQKSGSGAKKAYMPAATKLLTLLLEGMREQGVIAVAELTTRGVPKPCVLTSDGRLWQVYHTNALREQRELPEVDLVPAEVEMMKNLIATLTKEEVADLSDKRSELIQNFADEKAAAGDFAKPVDTYTPAAVAEPAQDLMAMLQASVDQAKQKAV